MQKYDKVKMMKELVKYGKLLEPHQRAEIAALEQCSTPTIEVYLKGENIGSCALAAAIIHEAKRLTGK